MYLWPGEGNFVHPCVEAVELVLCDVHRDAGKGCVCGSDGADSEIDCGIRGRDKCSRLPIADIRKSQLKKS